MPELVAQTSRYSLKQYLPDFLLLLVLLALTLKFGHQLAVVRDIGTDDETYYLAHAHYLSKLGFPEAGYSPLYVLWYYGWDQFKLDPTVVYYANWKVLIFLVAAGMYILMRALGSFRSVALVFAFLTLTSGVAEVWPFPMHLATFVLAIGAATAARLRSWPWSLAAIGATFAVTSFLRAEFTYSLLLFCPVALVCAAWVAFKRPELRVRLLVALCLVAVLIGVLFNRFGNPLTGGRSFFAFGAHYSWNVWSHNRTDLDPWTNWETITRADFGDAKSIAQALRNNPRAVLWHVSCNLGYLPQHLDDITTSRLELEYNSQVVFRIALAAFAAFGTIGFFLRLFRPSLAGDPHNCSLRIVLGMLFFVAAPSVASIVVIFPRQHYLVPLVCCGGALTFSGYLGFPRLISRVRWLNSWPALLAFVALLVAITPNKVHRWSVQQRLRTDWARDCPTLEVQRTVAAMRELDVHPTEPINVLESDYSRAFYAGWDFKEIERGTKTEGFWEFVGAHNISVVVLNERLLTDTRFRDDPAFQEFAAEKKIRHFRFFAVPETKVRLAVREDLLSARYFLAITFLRSREYQTAFVLRNYHHYLGRTASISDVGWWVNRMQEGVTPVRSLAMFLSSGEFYARAGNTDKSWVNALYQTLLGRTAKTTEETHSLLQLANDVSRVDVVLSILASQEWRRHTVEEYYQHYLGRTAEAAELVAFSDDMQSGSTERILASIISSQEFYRRAGDNEQAWEEALYLNLRKGITDDGLQPVSVEP